MPATLPPRPKRLLDAAAGDARISLIHYPAGLDQPAHAHDHAGASVLLAGALYEDCAAGGFAARVSSCVWKAPGAVHATRFGPAGATLLSVAAPAATGRKAGICWMRRPVEDDAVDALLAALLAGRPSDLEEAALDFLAGLEPAAAPEGEAAAAWLHAMFDRLAEEPASAPSVAVLARQSGIDPAYASRAFRKCFGLAPLRHRRRARSRSALDLLLRAAPPAAAASACGYADQSHLTRDLRDRFGVTPGAIRRKVKNLQDRTVLSD